MAIEGVDENPAIKCELAQRGSLFRELQAEPVKQMLWNQVSPMVMKLHREKLIVTLIMMSRTTKKTMKVV